MTDRTLPKLTPDERALIYMAERIRTLEQDINRLQAFVDAGHGDTLILFYHAPASEVLASLIAEHREKADQVRRMEADIRGRPQ